MKIITVTILIVLSLFAIGCSDSIKKEKKVQSLYEKGLEITAQLDRLAESEEYIKMFSLDPEIRVIAKEIGSIDYSTPKAVYEISGIDTAYMKLLSSQADIKLSQEIKDIVKNKFVASIALASMLSSQNGTNYLAVTTIITINDSFIYSGLKKQKTYLFLYEGDYASIITFMPVQNDIVISYASIGIVTRFTKIKTVDNVATFLKNTIQLTNLEISLVTK